MVFFVTWIYSVLFNFVLIWFLLEFVGFDMFLALIFTLDIFLFVFIVVMDFASKYKNCGMV